MDIRQMRYFAAVVEEKTVTAAAKRLNMTQPPLTAQLHQLEDELGCRLFRHEGRRIYLTEAGQHFYHRATEILGRCDTVKQEMADYREGTVGTLRIGVISSVQGTLFTVWMKQFQELYPDVKLAIYSKNTYQLLESIQNKEIDLAIIRTPFSAVDLDVMYLQRERILAVGDRSYFHGIDKASISMSELSSMPLIIYRRWQKVIEASFEAAGCTPQIYCVNDDARMTLLLAMQKMGVGLLHPSALPQAIEASMELRVIEDESLASQIALVCQSKRLLPQPAKLFWQMLDSIKTFGCVSADA
ncbi:MAG: LysR family transcriptional regulator [Oscillospiraceae bacterium]|nr:LysR family transcriptional regulator [Oscillospiraceae bacterium]